MMRIRTYNNLARDFAEMAQTMNRALEQGYRPYDYAAAGGAAAGGATSAGVVNGDTAGSALRRAHLPLDAWESEEGFTLVAYLPGVNPDDVEITFEGEELRIGGRYPQVVEERSYIKRELFHGEFERRLAFNVPVDVEAIEAVYENGLLTLTVPKAQVIRPKQIKVLVRS
jgi:HSP20 family molecular chaperone IbpA